MVTGEAPRVAFLWDMTAGHVANFERSEPLLDAHPRIASTLTDVWPYDDDYLLERVGGMRVARRWRPFVTVRRALAAGPFDAVWSNAPSVRGSARSFTRQASVFELDATLPQLRAMPEYAKSTGRLAHRRDRRDGLWLRRVTRFRAWSAWARDGLVRDHHVDPDRIRVIPPGVELGLWHPPGESTPSADDPVRRIVFVGGDFARKGGDDLLAWFDEQHDDSLELHLVTPAEVSTRRGVFVHRLSADDPAMHELVRTAHVAVLPSHAECFGIASLEALASGVPVVQTDVGGAGDIVRPGETGHLIAPRSPRAIGEAITAILSDPPRYAAMRRAARADAEARFGLHDTLDRLVDLIQEAIDAFASGRSTPPA